MDNFPFGTAILNAYNSTELAYILIKCFIALFVLIFCVKIIKIFNSNDKHYFWAITSFIIIIFCVLALFLMERKSFSITLDASKKLDLNSLKVFYEKSECSLEDDTTYNCTYSNEINCSELTCKHPNASSKFSINSDTFNIDTKLLMYHPDKLNLSIDKQTFKASFILLNPITNEIVSIPDKKINVEICGLPVEAKKNNRSEYIIIKQWNELEMMLPANCPSFVELKYNTKRIEGHKKFNLIIPYNKEGTLFIDNDIIFNGRIKQNRMNIPTDGYENYQMDIKLKIKEPLTAITLQIGDKLLKIDGKRLIFDDNQSIEIESEIKVDVPATIQLQKDNDKRTIWVKQDEASFLIHTFVAKEIEESIQIGYSRVKRTKNDVLSISPIDIKKIENLDGWMGIPAF